MITECVRREVSCEYCRGSFIVENKQGLVQQVESLTGQAVLVDKTTNQTNDETNKIGATNDKSEEGNTMKQGFKPESINDIEVGMKVLFSSLGKLRGTVKYVGPVCGLGLVVGIVLDPEEPVWLGYRECNGTYEGKRYFSCAPGRGCFTTFDNVLKCYR
ncbi:uncharacterized protein [Pocillopora verrucosa]|uniref:uncharacterized protein isoform X2 n=1 Tax=Pocillopora verrucosa TaxID=203993 RepID=UPI0033424BE4